MLTLDRTPDSDDNADGKEIYIQFEYVCGLQEYHPDLLPVDCTTLKLES